MSSAEVQPSSIYFELSRRSFNMHIIERGSTFQQNVFFFIITMNDAFNSEIRTEGVSVQSGFKPNTHYSINISITHSIMHHKSHTIGIPLFRSKNFQPLLFSCQRRRYTSLLFIHILKISTICILVLINNSQQKFRSFRQK